MYRDDFPMLKKDIIYLDNGATSLKPQTVIDKIVDYYENYSANAHRGDYDISYKVDLEYENTRELVKNFIGARKKEEIVFTSGTTDITKGVMLSHRNLCCNVYAGCKIYRYEQTDVILSILPFYHLFGLVCILFTSIICGNKIFLSNVRDFFADLKTINPTTLVLVPEIVKFLLLKT